MALDERIPSQNYPFVTQDGDVIPLDIIKPTSVYLQQLTVGVSTNISITTSTGVAFVYASAACLLSANGDISGIDYNSVYDGTLFVPKKHVMSVTIEDGNIFLLPLEEAGYISIQFIERWAGLELDTNFITR